MLAWLTFKNIRNSSGKNETFVKIATWILMRTWLVFENVCNSFGNNESSNKHNANASWLKGNLHHRFSRESLCENEKHVFLQRSSCTPVITAFQKNYCARIRKMSPTNGRQGPLSSPLLQRILVRESKRQKQQTKKHTTIQTRNRKPRQQKAPVGGDVLYSRLKGTFCKMYEIP